MIPPIDVDLEMQPLLHPATPTSICTFSRKTKIALLVAATGYATQGILILTKAPEVITNVATQTIVTLGYGLWSTQNDNNTCRAIRNIAAGVFTAGFLAWQFTENLGGNWGSAGGVFIGTQVTALSSCFNWFG